MAFWQITAGQNDGYPLYSDGATTSLSLWMAGVKLPNHLWRIITDLNDNYPTLPFDWVDITSIFDGIIPVGLWRIVDGVNDNYPYRWYQIAVESGYINQGDAVIGSDDDMKNYIDNKGLDGDDPISRPNDPGKRENKIIGDKTGAGAAARIAPQSGVQYYVMTPLQLTYVRNLIWAQPKSFYEALNIINAEGTDTIFNYISSLRFYPFSDITTFIDTDLAYSDIVLGTGAVLQDVLVSPNTSYQLRSVSKNTFQTWLCYWDLSNLPWRDNFLDFTPYSKLVITIPYCGDVELDLNRIVAFGSLSNTILWLYCSGDIDTGTITFTLLTGAPNAPYDQILYTKNVKVAIDLPLSGNDQISQSNAILQSTYKLTSTTLQTVSSLISSAEKTGGKLASNTASIGDVAKFATDAVQGVMDVGMASAEASLAKRQVPVSIGDINGTVATTQIRQFPYLTLYRQKTANPDNYGHTTGYVCEAALTLSSIEAERTRQGIPHAFTALSNPDLGNVSGATQEELEELMGILTTGFYV